MSEIKPNGAICDRCKLELTAHAYALTGDYEYVCDGCLTPAEILAYGAMSEEVPCE